MSEELTSAQQTPGQPEENWEARYKGSVRKVEELVLASRGKDERISALASELEQVKAQLSIKDTEKTAAIGERDKQLQSTIQSKTQLEAELGSLRAFKLKVEVAKELGKPGLLKILDKLPDMTDRDALKGVLADFAAFADEAASEREKQLLAGITPAVSAPQKQNPNPTSDDGWQKLVNDYRAYPLGSAERSKLMDDYWAWGMNKP